LAVAGLIGCVTLAFSLAPFEIAIGICILGVGVAFRLMNVRLNRKAPM
jgi:hypothetical protein